jgi:hypothetical protein
MTNSNTKRCPYCAETIQYEARVCRYCNRDLVIKATPAKSANDGSKSITAALGSVLSAIALVWFVFGGSRAFLPNSATEGGPSPAQSFLGPSTRRVTYRVTGTALSASLTYQNAQGGTVQRTVGLPWEASETFKDGDFVYISAQNQGDSGGVTTEILVDGTPWKKTTSDGAYMIASCDGSVSKP